MFLPDKVNELNEHLDKISFKIKEMEKQMRGIPLDITIDFLEINEIALLIWDSEKKRIIYLDNFSKPLIECKLNIRIKSWDALDRLEKQALMVIDEFIQKIKEKSKK